MSNTLAIATVTATLRSILNDAVSGVVHDAVATYLRPDSQSLTPPCVNIFLYQVTPSPAWRNSDLPTRKSDGTLLQRPRTGLDLHYLLTFHGDDGDLLPQLMLGAVVLELHAAPILPRDRIATVAATETGSGGRGNFLQNSDLADQVELVRFAPTSLSLEELSKLWMTFPDVDYVLSAVYVASVVLIETDDQPPGPALPVLKPNVTAIPFSLAVIDAVEPQPVELALSPPTPITLIGRNLDPGDDALFTTPGQSDPLIGTVQPGPGGDELTVLLPAGLHPGVNTVRLAQLAPVLSPPPTSPPSPHVLAQSNAAAFILRPTVVSIGPGSPPGSLTAVVSPKVGPKQQVFLLLNQIGVAAPLAFALPAAPHATETDTFTFDLTGFQGGPIPPGEYLARVRVDEAESALNVDPSGGFSGPTVTIP
jgi:hypothetical protein